MLTRAYLKNVRASCKPLHLGDCWISTATSRLADKCLKWWLQVGMPINVHSKWVIGSYLSPYMTLPLYWGCLWGGKLIDCNQSHSGGSLVEKLLNRHLKTTSPEQTKLVTLLTKPSIKVPNRVSLYLALVLSYFLFPTTSQKANINLLPLLDDRANLGRYAWGKAAYEFLVSGLNRIVASKQAKKARGNLHIQGCTALLQVKCFC